MERSRPENHSWKNLASIVGALLIAAFLALMTGCQGVSAGGSSSGQGTLSLGAASLDFGSVKAGTGKTLTVLATNSGSTSLTVSSVAMSSKYFTLTSPNLPVTIASGQSASINVMFSPNSAGAFNGTATVASNASNPSVSLPLSGTGVAPGQLTLNSSIEAFGNVTTGTQQSQTVTLTNSGGMSVSISQAAVSGLGFQISGLVTPLILSASQSTSFTVTFAPQSAGNATGTVTITSNASNPTLTLPLAGTGVSPGMLGNSPSSLSFGNVTVGSNQSLSETITNTGGSSLTISQITVSGTGFTLSGISTPLSLSSGQSATFNVTFAPTSSASASGNITISSTAPVLTIPLSGVGINPGQLTASPSSETFGSVTTGTQQSQTVTLTNTGGTTVNISQATVTGTGFQLSGITVPLSLTPSQSTTLKITFAPQSTGSATGTVSITSDANNPTLTISLSGSGIAPGGLTPNPSSLNFGNVTVGKNSSISETVTNTGGSSVTISQVGVSGSGFSITGISTPLTLAAGQASTFSVTFAPTSAATASGSVTVTSNASNPSVTIPLAATGVSPGVLSANPTSLSFGSVTVGNNKTLSETITNTGGTSVTISQVAVSGGGFSVSGISTPLTLAAGQSATFGGIFTPTSATTASGTITITSNASNATLTIPLSGTGVSPGTLGSNPTSLSFGSVTVGNNKTLSETITNTGGTSVTISQVAVSGSGFSVSGISTPLTLAAGQSASLSGIFTPTSATSASGTITITSNASNPSLSIPLSGTGVAAVGQLTITPSTLSLGSVVDGNSASAQGTLTASGATVTVTAATTNNSVFSVGGLTLPVSIPAGQSVPFTITFSPLTTGTINGTLTVTSNAQPSTSTETLTGTGLAAATHSVALSWTASTSSNISGYNVYRAVYTTVCGSFSKINAMLNASTVYTDSTVTNGASYCYAATAVDTTSAESGYSNIVSNVQIPVQ